jgi:signal peptidase II
MKIDNKYLNLATIAGALVALDQLTKLFIHSSFELGQSVPVIKGYFHITYVRNLGAAFGIFRDHSELFRKLFFLSVPPIALVIVLMMLRGVNSKDRWQVFALSLIFGGAVGNYIDRLRFGYVVDFLDFHFYDSWSYPAFNVADSGIVCGVILLLIITTVRDRASKMNQKLAQKA